MLAKNHYLAMQLANGKVKAVLMISKGRKNWTLWTKYVIKWEGGKAKLFMGGAWQSKTLYADIYLLRMAIVNFI